MIARGPYYEYVNALAAFRELQQDGWQPHLPHLYDDGWWVE